MRLSVRNLQDRAVPAEVISAAAGAALRLAGQELDGLSVALVDGERIARLNHAHLGHEGPTDVLSFPAEPGEEGRCGEVILCVEVAEEQARERGHSLAHELAILTAHGTLHTLGYRDDTPAARARMEALQEEAARGIG
jgi:probable rRNA maturation factor